MLPSVLSIALVAALAATAPPPSARHLSVVGTARVSFKPNQLFARFVVVGSHRDQAGVKKVADEKLRKFVEAVRAAGVDPRGVTIEGVGGPSPEYRGSEIVSYSQSCSVSLSLTDLSRVDEVLAAASRAGGVLSGQAVLQATDHQQWEAKARQVAATEARERAKVLLEALGGKVGLPSAVTDSTPVVEQLAVGTYAVGADGSVNTGWASRELVVNAHVTVQFDIDAP